MTPDQFLQLIEKKRQQLEAVQRQIMPVKGGAIAKSHFQNNIIKGGFVDNGLHKWTPAKRLSKKSNRAANRYPTLLSSRRMLFGSINYTPGNGMVTIYNRQPYAAIHNEGGTITIPQRQQIMHFTRKGKLTFKHARLARYAQRVTISQSTIKMPKRQFIGESRELTEKINKKFESEIRQVLNQP